MIEVIVLNYLNSTLRVPAYMEVPVDAPAEYVLLEKTGSSVENCIETATITVQSYANTLFQAASLNEEVKEAMKDIVSLREIMGVELNSDYNFTDATKKKYRYQAVFELIF